MWIKAMLFATLALLGNAAILNDIADDSRSLDALIEELKNREIRRPGEEIVEECQSKPADIAFIIDDSRSIYGPDFIVGMKFIQSFVRIFQIGPQDVRIAAVTFGQVVITYSAFGFEANNNKREVLEALGRIKFEPDYGGKTFTDKAITYARRNFFNHARPNVKKVAIVLTDGRSDNPPKTKAEADLLKSQDVDIIAIGVGSSVDESELHAIASSPDNVFLVNSYGALKDIILSLGFITCRAASTAAPTTTTTPTTPTTTPTTTTTTTTTTPPPKAEPCDGQEIDFNFVFDPAQMGTSGTEDAIRFIKTVVSAEDLNNGKVRVGTITGPCPDTKGFHLNRYQNLPDILTHFDSYRTTEIYSLITDLRMEGFEPENGGRPNARKVGVLFLRGKLSYPERAKLEAKLAQTKGIEMFIVDMGSLNHESVLESLASGKSSHILRASDSGEMIEMARTLVAHICKKKAGGSDC